MKAVKNVLTSWVILNHVMFMLNLNESITVANLQKLANQSILNGALLNISFSES